MQKCSFSETQFSFLFTHELITIHPHFGIPFLPDTVAEGKFYGFDMCVGNYFFQFKRSHLYDIGDTPSKFFERFNTEYFKIEIKADKKQFKHLKKISSINSQFNKVVYATPRFHTRIELNNRFQNTSVIDNGTAFFQLNNFPDSLSGNHYLIYTSTGKEATLYSEPFNIPIYSLNDIRINTKQTFENRLSLTEMAQKIEETIISDDEFQNYSDSVLNIRSSYVKNVWGYLFSKYKIYWCPVLK